MSTPEAVKDTTAEQSETVTILKNLRDQAFESSDEKLALALGRPTEEIAAWISGAEAVDEDAVMKAHAIAQERGIEI